MNLITIEGKTYEEAIKKAHLQYGDNLRFISRKIVQKNGFLGIKTGKYCELTCYLIDENKTDKVSRIEGAGETENILIERFVKEAKTPDPNKITDNTNTLPEYVSEHIKKIIAENYFSSDFSEFISQQITEKLKKYLGSVDTNIVDKCFVDCLSEILTFDNKALFKPSSQIMLVGPPGSGKTLNSARLACLYNSGENTNAHLAYFGKKYVSEIQNVGVRQIKNINDFKNIMINQKPRVLIIDSNESVDDIGRGIISFSNNIPEPDFSIFLNVPSTMKYQDMLLFLDKYKILRPSGLVFSFMDLTSDIGNVISFIWKSNLPVLFVSESNNLSSGIQSPVPSYFTGKLKGLTC